MAARSTPRKKPNPAELEAEAFLRVFEERLPDGNYRFSDDTVRAFVPLLVFGGGQLPSPVSPELQRLMDGFLEGLGITDKTTPAQLQEKVDAHYKAHPVNKDLLNAFKAAVISVSQESGTRRGAQGARLLGAEESGSAKVPVGQRAAPAGALKAAAWRLQGHAADVPSKGGAARADKTEAPTPRSRKKR